ncbi:MAG TPA: DUF2279 domain-containing protein, partial [Thermoanaerobaculia bacterium]|nr:DUF2279 domain-containing protein [Thermoanaerobaculia bacterium]
PFGLGPAGEAFGPRDRFRLDAAVVAVAAEDPPKEVRDDPPSRPPPPPAPPKLFDTKTTLFTAGVVVATPLAGYFAWWKDDWTGHFRVTDEGWFGEETYTGGADKASHITFSYMFTLAFQSTYRALGKSPAEARGLAFGLTVLSGLLIEVGDGFSRYGFSWQDLAADTIGAGVATLVDAFGLKDTVGLRFGWVSNSIPPPCCRYYGFGSDYSGEIYAADLKLAGLLPRMGTPPGPARFFLVGVTYGSKGYRHSPPWYRQRQLGVEIGLSIPEVLRAVGVKETTWWGKTLLTFFTYFRVPYTAFGWQVDLNSGRWYGPNAGGSYDPGYILYP